MTGDRFNAAYEQVLSAASLSVAQTEGAFIAIMNGVVEPIKLSAFLTALRMRGEHVDEITGAARVIRSKAKTIIAPDDAVDTAGTGGDGAHTYNISTAAALVAASVGVPIAKHGNRAVSSKSGSADVLASLGINLDLDPEQVETSIKTIGIGFLMATKYHAAMANVAPVRRAMGTRTIFNLLGPLANPAGAKRQLIGVYDPKWLEPMANVAGRLGGEHIWAVHGAGGLDELSTLGPTQIVEWKDGTCRTFQIDAQDYGIKRATLAALKGGDADENAQAIRDIFAGTQNAYSDIVALNAAAAIHLGGKADNLKDGIEMAITAMKQRNVQSLLQQWISFGKKTA